MSSQCLHCEDPIETTDEVAQMPNGGYFCRLCCMVFVEDLVAYLLAPTEPSDGVPASRPPRIHLEWIWAWQRFVRALHS